MLRLVLLGFLALLAAGAALAQEIDPIDTQLQSELQRLKVSYERAVEAAKNEAIKKYERLLRQAMQREDLKAVNAYQVKIAALGGQRPPTALTVGADVKASDFEAQILGDWVVVNAEGKVMSPMRIEKIDNDTYELIRIGGGAYAICGEYKIEKGQKLVKVRKPNDAYWDLTWHYSNGKLRLKEGQYKNWVLKREK